MKAGTRPDLASVYASHASFVRRQLARRGVCAADLDDVVHDAFITLHRLLPDFEGRASIETWLRSVVWRVAADYHRRKWRPGAPGLLAHLGEEDVPLLGVDRFHASFASIDGGHRDLLALHEIGGLSISSIAELEGSARVTIRNRLARDKVAVQRALRANTVSHDRDAWHDQMTSRFRPRARPPVLHTLPCGLTCFSTLGDVVLAVWRGPASAEAMHLLIEVMMAHLQAWPEGIRYINIVERTSTPPAREARSLFVWLAREIGPNVRAAATIVDSSALMALSASVINSCLFLARSTMNLRFYSDLGCAVPWIAQYGQTDVAETHAHVQRMRDLLGRSLPVASSIELHPPS